MQNQEPSDVGKRLRQAREKRGITANALSLKMKPSPGRSWVGWVESGKVKDPSVGAVRKCAAALGVEFEWLLLGSGPMTRRKKAESKAVATP